MNKIFIILVAVCFYLPSFSQSTVGNDSSRYIRYPYAYGTRQPRLWADSVLGIPKDTIYSKYGLATKNGVLYFGNWTKWVSLGQGGGSTGVSVVSYGINTSNDSSILILSDGTRYAVKLGSGGSGISVVSYGLNLGGDSSILVLSNGSRYAAPIGTGGGTPIDTANKWIQSFSKNISNDSFIVYKNGVRYAYKDNSGSSGGGGGSGISQLGLPAYGLIRVNDSTYNVDTTVILDSSKVKRFLLSGCLVIDSATNTISIDTVCALAYVKAQIAVNAAAIVGKLNIADTASMLANYFVKINKNIDSLNAHNARISAKQNIITLTTSGSGSSTFNQSTGALNIPVPAGTTYTGNAPIVVAGSVISADTINRYTGLATIGKAVNDSIVLRSLTNTNTASILLKLNISDTAAMQANEVRSVVLNTPSVIFSSPVNFSTANHVASGSLGLNNQSAYTLFGRGAGSGTPSFLSGIDSNWVTGLHTEAYYNTKYGGGGGSSVADTLQTYTSGASVTVNNGVNILVVNPATLQSALTVTLPAIPSTKNQIEIYFGGTIAAGSNVVTTVTIAANTGQSLFESLVPTTMGSGEYLSYKWIPSLNRWYAKR